MTRDAVTIEFRNVSVCVFSTAKSDADIIDGNEARKRTIERETIGIQIRFNIPETEFRISVVFQTVCPE